MVPVLFVSLSCLLSRLRIVQANTANSCPKCSNEMHWQMEVLRKTRCLFKLVLFRVFMGHVTKGNYKRRGRVLMKCK